MKAKLRMGRINSIRYEMAILGHELQFLLFMLAMHSLLHNVVFLLISLGQSKVSALNSAKVAKDSRICGGCGVGPQIESVCALNHSPMMR